MFDNLRRAFREAVDNFKDELDRDNVPEAVDSLLREMKREAADTKADISRLEDEIEKAVRGASSEKKREETCRRRAKMAKDIGDEETARVALEYAVKHQSRREMLEHKALASKEELDLRKGEFAEMIETIKDADKNRATLAATAGRSKARNSIEGADDLFAELDRIAEDIEGDEDRREASQEVEEALYDREAKEDLADRLDDLEEESAILDVDARLEALKRAMGRED